MLVSSHLMSELQDTADHLVIVGRGRVIADTSMTALLASRVGRPGHGAHRRAGRPPLTVLERAGATVTVAEAGLLTVSGLAAAPGGRRAQRRRVPFSEVAAHRATLEQAYLELTRDAVDYRAEARTVIATALRAEWTKFRTVRGWVHRHGRRCRADRPGRLVRGRQSQQQQLRRRWPGRVRCRLPAHGADRARAARR